MAAQMVWERSLAPDSFINPTLPLYLMMPALWLQARAADLGLAWGVGADPLLVGRALSALAGAGAVLLLGLAARSSATTPGVLAPLLLALAPGFVNLCHFATPEAWLLLATSGIVLLSVQHARGRAPAWALGCALGLGLATKYTAAALAAPVLAAVWLRESPTRERRSRVPLAALGVVAVLAGATLLSSPGTELAGALRMPDARLLEPAHARGFVRAAGLAVLLAGAVLVSLCAAARAGWRGADRLARPDVAVVLAAAALAFAAVTPYALLRPIAFLSDLAFDHQTRLEYKGLASSGPAYLGYLGLLADALTGPLLGAAVVGALFALARALRGDRSSTLVLLAALAPYLLVASSGHQAMRFLAPALPAAAWLGALCPLVLPSPRMGRLLTVLIVARVALGAAVVLRLFYWDSRGQAERWMEAHIPEGAAVDIITNYPGYAPTVSPGRPARVVPTLSREMAPPERFRQAAARYPADAADWVVLTAAYYERYLENPTQAPDKAAFFKALLAGQGGFEVVARFRQDRWLRPRAEFLDPEIVILRKRVG